MENLSNFSNNICNDFTNNNINNLDIIERKHRSLNLKIRHINKICKIINKDFNIQKDGIKTNHNTLESSSQDCNIFDSTKFHDKLNDNSFINSKMENITNNSINHETRSNLNRKIITNNSTNSKTSSIYEEYYKNNKLKFKNHKFKKSKIILLPKKEIIESQKSPKNNTKKSSSKNLKEDFNLNSNYMNFNDGKNFTHFIKGNFTNNNNNSNYLKIENNFISNNIKKDNSSLNDNGGNIRNNIRNMSEIQNLNNFSHVNDNKFDLIKINNINSNFSNSNLQVFKKKQKEPNLDDVLDGNFQMNNGKNLNNNNNYNNNNQYNNIQNNRNKNITFSIKEIMDSSDEDDEDKLDKYIHEKNIKSGQKIGNNIIKDDQRSQNYQSENNENLNINNMVKQRNSQFSLFQHPKDCSNSELNSYNYQNEGSFENLLKVLEEVSLIFNYSFCIFDIK